MPHQTSHPISAHAGNGKTVIMEYACSCRDFVLKNRLESVCIFLYLLIFAGFFFLPTPTHRCVMYISLPFSLFYIREHFALLKEGFWKHRYFTIPLVAFLAYTALSALWSTPLEDGFTFNETKPVLFIPLSMATLYLIVLRNPFVFNLLIYAFIAGALCSGIYLLIDNWAADPLSRMEGLGRAGNPVMGGYLYCIAILTLFFAKPLAGICWKYKLPVAIIFAYVMMLMLSRSPIIVLGATFAILLVVRRQYKILLTLALLAIVSAASIVATSSRDVIPIINRPDTGRSQVWQGTFDKIAESPLWGHGIATKFFYPIYDSAGGLIEKAPHAHSFYLGTLVQGGIISLAFLLYFIVVMERKSYRMIKNTGEFWMFAVFTSCILMGLMNFAGTVNNLAVIWVAFWYPCVLIMAMDKPKATV